MKPIAIELINLSFAYEDTASGDPILEDINLCVRTGECLCLLGPSGAGKSTLLNIIAGLLPGYTGEILLFGQSMQGPGTDRALVFQQDSLFPWQTALKNVIFGIRQAKPSYSKEEIKSQASKMLTSVGLASDQNKYPNQLSGGMKQRVAIARALAMESPILLLDEPFGALDVKRRQEMQQLLLQLQRTLKDKRTILFVTHDIEEAFILADRIALLHEGKIKQIIELSQEDKVGREESVSLQRKKREMIEWFAREGEKDEKENE